MNHCAALYKKLFLESPPPMARMFFQGSIQLYELKTSNLAFSFLSTPPTPIEPHHEHKHLLNIMFFQKLSYKILYFLGCVVYAQMVWESI